MKNALKRMLSFALALVMVLSMAPSFTIEADAATISGLSDSTIGLDGTASKWTASGNSLTGSITGSKVGSFYFSASTTLTITNNKTTAATLSFDFAATGNFAVGSSVTVDGTEYTVATTSSFSKELAAGGSITIKLAADRCSASNGANTIGINITNLSLAASGSTTTTFQAPDYGSYTVTYGTTTKTIAAGDASQEISNDNSVDYTMTVTLPSGYKFVGWKNVTTGKYLSTETTFTSKFDTPSTIQPIVVPNSTAVFLVGTGNYFTDLDDAVTYATSNSQTQITLFSSGTISDASYTIPAGITLLIPKDTAHTPMGDEPECSTAFTTPSAFRTLTLAANTKITVEENANIEVEAIHTTLSGGSQRLYGGRPCGDYGAIYMNDGSNITLNSSATLYAWGYVYGSGSVTANSGATVYEYMQVTDFPGGSNLSGFVDTAKDADADGDGNMENDYVKSFPFSQYYVQNIEVPLTIYAGATEYVYATITVSSQNIGMPIEFIGANGMFIPTSGSVTKDYDHTTDRLVFDLNGDATVSSIILDMGDNPLYAAVISAVIGTTKFDSSMYILGLNSNITINVNSGTGTIGQDIALQPGVEVYVDSGATLYLASGESTNLTLFGTGGNNVYAYDLDEWGNFVFSNSKLIAASYSPQSGRHKRTAADLKDVLIDINGTVIADGYLYSTVAVDEETWLPISGGANVISSQGTGKVIMNNGAGIEEFAYRLDGTSAADDITSITSVWLKNDAKYAGTENEFTKTTGAEAGSAYIYDKTEGMWKLVEDATITFDGNGGSAADAVTTTQTVSKDDILAGNKTTLNTNTFTREGYKFLGWNTDKNATTALYADGAEVDITTDTTLYAIWQVEKYFIYIEEGYLDGDETGPAYDDGEVELEYGQTITDEMLGTPTKDGYTFTGWLVTDGADTIEQPTTMPAGDLYYLAQWEKVVVKYTLTFLDDNGEVLAEHEYEEGKTVTAAYPSYTKPNYTITWSAAIPTTLTEDVEITAIATPNVYTLTFMDGTENVGESEANEDNGWKANIIDQSKTGAQFQGWAETDGGEVKYSAGQQIELSANKTLYAVWTINQYTITLNANGGAFADGEAAYTTSGSYGEAPEYPTANPTREGWSFTGWADEAGNKITTLPTTFDGNKTYYASWEQIQVTVSYETNGGSAVTGTTVNYGQTVTIAAAPTLNGYTFAGWSVSNDNTADAEYAVGTQITLKADLKLYAVWTVNSYTITFANTGDSVMENKTVAYGDAIGTIADPTKTGYTFASWTITDADGNAVTIVDGKMPAKNLTYTAVWNINTYTIGWDIDGDGKADYENTVEHGKTPAYDGSLEPTKVPTDELVYTFKDWGTIVPATGPVVYIAQFSSEARTYTITWIVNGEDTTTQVAWGVVPTAPTVEGYADNYNTYAPNGWDKEIVAVNGDATYTALFTATPIVYTITFVTGEGATTVAPISGGYGDAVTAPAEPTKTGHSFKGWSPALPETLSENLTVTAQWEKNTYTITFKGEIGKNEDKFEIEDQVISKLYGEAITEDDLPTVPRLEGYELHWYIGVDEEAENPYENAAAYTAPSTMPAENAVVYARWSLIPYILRVQSSIDGKNLIGSYMDVEESYQSIEDFNEINSFNFTNPAGAGYLTPEGYTFAGYKYADGNEMTFPIESWPAEEITIIAQFVPNEYTISFENCDTADITLKYGEAITAPADPTAEGKTFSHWYTVDAEDGETVYTFPATMPAENVTVYAKWTVNTFTVNFLNGDGSAYKTIEVDYGTELVADDLLAQVTGAPTKEGYSFISWNLEGLPETMPAKAVNIEANWQINQYTITFADCDVPAITQDYGTAITAPEAPTKEGHTFAGWSENVPATMPAKDLTITANWTVNQYTITFADCDIAPITQNYGTALAVTEPTKDGFVFVGWKDQDGSDCTIPATMPAKDQTLTAQWVKASYLISWDTNGDGTVDSTAEVAYNTMPEAPAASKAETTAYTYEFIGWTPEVAVATADVTYTATFTEVAKSFTVTWNTDGGNVIEDTTVVFGMTIELPADPEKEGYKFLGWSPELPNTMPAENLTFVAQWQKKESTITFTDLETTIDTVTQAWGSEVMAPTAPTKAGHTFAGWYLDGEKVTFPYIMPETDLVFTAGWDINMYTVTFVDGFGNEVSSEEVAYAAPVVTPDALADRTVEGGVYQFVEWTDVPLAMPDEDVTITAKWTYTGWLTDDIGTTYLVNSEKAYFSAWADIGDATYYFDANGYIVKDITQIDGNYYAFDHELGSFMGGYTGIYEALNGDLYYVERGVAVQNKGLVKVTLDDGHIHYYYFGCGTIDCSADPCLGEYVAQKSNRHFGAINNGYLIVGGFTTGADGVIEHIDDTSVNGVYEIDGVKYYLMDGVKVHKGLFMIGEDYYYARSSGELVIGRSYWVSGSKLNGLDLKAGTYQFDDQGRIVFPEDKNGFYFENDAWYYYENNALCYAGLTWFDGTDSYNDLEGWQAGPTANDPGYYYVNSSCMLVTDRAYWISKNNGLMKNTTYYFDENGTMYEPVVELKQGFYYEDDAWYYYQEGELYYAGLVWFDGTDSYNDLAGWQAGPTANDPGYYYVNSKGMLVADRAYWISKNNGLMKNKTYYFDENGTMYEPVVEAKEGFYYENDAWYYYENGELCYAGLIYLEEGPINGEAGYYYINSAGKLITGRDYWISKGNGLMKNRSYNFDENGVMTNPQPYAN